MSRQTILVAAVVGMILALAGPAQAGFVGQLGVLDEAWFAANPTNPDTSAPWQAGDTYHLLFATDATTVASINPPVAPYDDIAFWDGKVQAEGNTAGGGAGAGVTWKVVGSTATVHARDHTAVSGPVYTMQGVPLASNYADLWDGSVANEITRMDGSSVDTGYASLIWTGSNSNGTAKGGYELGTTTRYAWCGDPKANSGPVGAQWMVYANPKQDFWRDMSIYGLSEALTVASTGAEDGFLHIFKFLDDCDGIYEPGDEILPPGLFWFDIVNLDTGLQDTISNCEEIPLEPGLYEITEQVRPGWIACSANPFQVQIEAGQLKEVYFGNVPAGEIPEPATMALLGLAACGLGGYVRRRRKA